VRALEGVRVDSVSDRTFLMHKGGKIEVNARLPLKTRDDLSMAYIIPSVFKAPRRRIGSRGRRGRRGRQRTGP